MRASLIVPAYNAAATVGDCLRALERQTVAREEYEIIVVDDGSTDGTAERAGQAEGVRVIRAYHAGPAAARNRGAREARGEILLFTDADCEPAEDWIEQMLAPFSDPGRNVAGAKGVYRTRQAERIARFVQREYEEKYEQMGRRNRIDFIDTYSAAYRRDVFLANGGFDESFPSASVEDQEFSFRLAEQGLTLVFVPHATVYHRHVTTVAAYSRRKLRIGFWRVRVARLHPGKAWSDSHTPRTLQMQTLLVPPFLMALLLTPFFPAAGWVALACAIAFVAVGLPLYRFVARQDRGLAAIALVLIPLRATALAAGIVLGVLAQFILLRSIERRISIRL